MRSRLIDGPSYRHRALLNLGRPAMGCDRFVTVRIVVVRSPRFHDLVELFKAGSGVVETLRAIAPYRRATQSTGNLHQSL